MHDYLNQYGGAERVLEALLELFPDAHLYTLFYDEKATGGRFRRFWKTTSFLDASVVARHHRLFIPLFPRAMKSLHLKERYDVVISDSAGFAKGIDTHGALHISYCHTPLRYAWETKKYVRQKFPRMGALVSAVVSPVAAYLRRWDKKAAAKPNILIANSSFIAEKIERYYGRQAEILYPPVDTERFRPELAQRRRGERYYLAVGRLLHYKRFDLIIDVFRALQRTVKIVGSGPEEKALRRRAKGMPNIEFISFLHNEEELRSLYANSEALLFPHVEDFGLVAAEALSCGTPVIAYRRGGACEIVEQGVTGSLFDEQSKEGFLAAINAFENQSFDRTLIRERALRFSKEHFTATFSAIVADVVALRHGERLAIPRIARYPQAV